MKGKSQVFFSAPHLQRRNILLFVSACPPQRLRLELHVIHHAQQVLFVVTE